MACNCCTGGGNPVVGLNCGACTILGGQVNISNLGPVVECNGFLAPPFDDISYSFWADFRNLEGTYSWVPGQVIRLAPASGPGPAGILFAQYTVSDGSYLTWYASALAAGGVSCQDCTVTTPTPAPGVQLCSSPTVLVAYRQKYQLSPDEATSESGFRLCSRTTSEPTDCGGCFLLDDVTSCHGSVSMTCNIGQNLFLGPNNIYCPDILAAAWAAVCRDAIVTVTW